MNESEKQGNEQERAPQPKPSTGIGTLICAYALSVIFPLLGLASGIYLWVSKKQLRHGVACISISCVVMFVEFLLVSSL